MKWMMKRMIILALALTVFASLPAALPVVAADSAPAPGLAPKSRLERIESISVNGEGNAPELVIRLSAPVIHTFFRTTSPMRLVVDLSQTTQGELATPLLLNKGNFKAVNINRFDTEAGVMTRLDIELARDAEPVFLATKEQPYELRISFPLLPGGTLQESPAPAAAVSPASAAGGAASPAPVAPDKRQPGPAAVSATPEPRLLKSISAGRGFIALAVAGGAAELKTFRLGNPERLVIDLFDVGNGMPAKIVPVNIAGVASARVGVYPGKTRVVFDALNGSFPEARTIKSKDGVTIFLNGAHPVETAPQEKAAEPAAAEKAAAIQKMVEKTAIEKPAVEKTVAAPLPSLEKQATEKAAAVLPEARKKGDVTPTITKNAADKGPPQIEMIDFQVVNGISRVAVKVSGDVSVDAPVVSPGFVTFTIKNAALPKRLQRSLEARAFASPVLRVTPFSVKTRKGAGARIRIALRAAAPHEFKQEGDMLFVDFKNPQDAAAGNLSKDFQEPALNALHGAKAPAAMETALDSDLAAPVEPPPAKAPGFARTFKGRKVTLEFADAEVRKIFQLLSEVSNKNFVLGDDVSGTISIKLVNVPWDQALDIILDTKGLDKREEGNIIIIKGKGKFKSLADEELELKKTLYKSIELKTETFNVNYSDLGGIVTQFTALKTERGTISPDPRTNKIIVKDIPQVIDEMRKLLVQLDVPERQVMIEARIVEATSTFTRNLGVNWGVHYRDALASFPGINQLNTGFGGLVSAPPTTGTGTEAGGKMGISFGTLAGNIQLDMRLNAAASAGMVKIVSTPKVATLNNKTAKITQGQQIPYTSSTSDKVETKFIEAALSLEVTPHINSNGTIVMKIDAKNDSPGTSSGGAAPPINKKQATTEMLLRDGETTVIGGIYVDSDTEGDDGVPFLMDIPLIGNLFKSNNKSKTKSELLVFITPRILGSL